MQETWVELKDVEGVAGWGSYVIRNYLAEKHFEIEWLVGPIPGFNGREIVMEYTANSQTQSQRKPDEIDQIEFFTDSNGRQNVQRIKNKRFSFNFTDSDIHADPITSNYYPITTGISNIYNR